MATDLAINSMMNRLAEYERRLAKLERYAASGRWIAYTPTLTATGWAVGDGTATGRYCRIGNLVNFWARITFGSTSTFSANRPVLSLPVTGYVSSTGEALMISGHANIGASWFYLWGQASGSPVTAVDLFAGVITATYLSRQGVSSTVPAAWANGDKLFIRGMYEAAE